MEAIFTAITIPAWAAGLGAFAIIALVLLLFRSGGEGQNTFSVLTQFALVVVIGGAAYLGLRQLEEGSARAERRALEERAAALVARASQPGSVLACVDRASEPALAEACERTLFAEPQRVAAALAHVRARLQFVGDAVAYASARDPSYLDRIKELRDDLGSDAYGFVAHVLATEYRCTAEACASFGLLRDPAKVKENLGAKRLETLVNKHAAAWREPEKISAPKPATETPTVAMPTPAPAPTAPETPERTSTTTPTTPAAPATPATPRPTTTPKQKDKAGPRATTTPNGPRAPTTAQRRIPEPVPGLPRVVPRRYLEPEEEETPAPATTPPAASTLPAPTPITPPRQN